MVEREDLRALVGGEVGGCEGLSGEGCGVAEVALGEQGLERSV